MQAESGVKQRAASPSTDGDLDLEGQKNRILCVSEVGNCSPCG